MNICVWGNCQSGVLGLILKDALPDASIEILPEVHLVKENEKDVIYNKLDAADVVFTQYIDKNYRYPWLSTDSVKRAVRSNVITFPNVYFDGYFPGLGNAFNAESVSLSGPLGSYHFSTIVKSYNEGATHIDATRSFLSEEQDFPQPDTAAASLTQLRARETGIDVIVSDVIEKRWRSARLFYTQNHPKNTLVTTLARRLLRRIGVRALMQPPYPQVRGLDVVDIPTQPHIRKKYGLKYKDTEIYSGVKFAIEGRNARQIGKQNYTASELVEQFLRFYEAVGEVKHVTEIARANKSRIHS